MSDIIDRASATMRPTGAAIGYQTWSDLTFIHWRVPVAAIRRYIPQTLDIDTYEGVAWLGLVPFYMSQVRPWWSPAVPGVSNFPETNLRTYVHLKGRDPGVWFFSLDAAKAIAVWIARTIWHLNYYLADMSVRRGENSVLYTSRRTKGDGMTSIETQIGGAVCESRLYSDGSGSTAEPGSLEYFLAERYFLYAQTRTGQLRRGQVHHRAYPLRNAQLLSFEETLTRANGIEISKAPDHVLFSPGVSVEIFPLVPVG